ncbi:MAG: hypothetical protein Q9195_002120 [Heterodermia aff. obscurata]
MTSSPSLPDPTTAIHDPLGYGREGRIGVDRETSARRKGIAAVLHQFATRGLKAPEAAQYDYLVAHGFYTVEELRECPVSTDVKVLDPAEEKRVAEYVKKVGAEKWLRRSNRIGRWERMRRERVRVIGAIQEMGAGSGSGEERGIVDREGNGF